MSQAKTKLSWVEMAMVVMILGIVASFAFPRLHSMGGEEQQLKERSLDMIKTSYAIAISDLMTFPTSEELAEYIDADNVKVMRGGGTVQFDFDATRMQVVTYADSGCTIPTSSPDQPILCVGDVKDARQAAN